MSEIVSSKTTAHTQTAASVSGLVPDVAGFANTWFALAMRNAEAWQNEMVGFMTRRFELDRLTLARFAECRSPLDIAKVQQDWFAKSIEAYGDEGRRCTAIALEPIDSSQKMKTAPKPQAVA